MIVNSALDEITVTVGSSSPLLESPSSEISVTSSELSFTSPFGPSAETVAELLNPPALTSS